MKKEGRVARTMGMQTTFVMVKPDGVQRGLVGNIIQRFENKGLRLVGLRQITPSLELAESHYAVPVSYTHLTLPTKA